MLGYTNRTADVYSYDKSARPIEGIPIVSAATAWTDKSTGTTYILVFNEALYYGTRLDHTLINPNQVRHHGIKFWDNPYDRERGLGIDVDGTLRVELKCQGTKIFFRSRAPSDEELRTCQHIQMTSDAEWNPETVDMRMMAQVERHLIYRVRGVCERTATNTPTQVQMNPSYIRLNRQWDIWDNSWKDRCHKQLGTMELSKTYLRGRRTRLQIGT